MNDEKENCWQLIKNKNNSYQRNIDKFLRRKFGIYYTDLKLTDVMIKKLFENMTPYFKKNIFSKTFFEPCVGTGNFVFSYLKYIYENFNYNKNQIKKLIYNIYVCDTDKDSLNIFLDNLVSFSRVFFRVEINRKRFSKNIGGTLLFDVKNYSYEIIEPTKYFKNIKFDIVITNPPYKNFKAEIRHYDKRSHYLKDKKYYHELKKIIENKFKYQGKGISNLYKLFVEKIIGEYVNKDGYVYLLIPNTILKDGSSTLLREFILKNNKLVNILNIDENKKYIDANQSLSALLINNAGMTSDIEIIEHFGNSNQERFIVNLSQIIGNINCSIIPIKENNKTLLNRMNLCKKIKDYDFIKNYRGEFDLTNNKEDICDKGICPIIRGRNISPFVLKKVTYDEFASNRFVNKTRKNKYINKSRICCPQISNMKSKKRLFFSYVPKDCVLGNSCNFIKVLDNDYGIDDLFLLGLLNSDIYNWYFKLFSSNNHISNYELDNLPIPNVSINQIRKLSDVVKSFIENKISIQSALIMINDEVQGFFSDGSDKSLELVNKSALSDLMNAFPSLDKNEALQLLSNNKYQKNKVNTSKKDDFIEKVAYSINVKYKMIEENKVLNHSSFKLSDLDMEMVRAISPGGNWKQIPLKTAEKSKRLMKIRQTGGRTTLYGRMSYLKPSYTITTYFNRPGNGTNIHPKHDRTMTVREAARIQGFPDSYYFYGNQKNKLTQIGNAVPPYMAYQIAQKIKENINVSISLDLFSGAGGMTTGFKLAGYKTVLMNDINEPSLITAQVNYPTAKAFLGDITVNSNREYLIDYAKKNKVDIINGGPPCQGFSLAGFRKIDDPRSKLIYDYVKILKKVSPKVFVFENVQGILSHNKGNTFKELLLMFDKVGYRIEAQLLDFSEYGIPQKRKRVIIIGVRKDINVLPEKLFPDKLTVLDNTKTTVGDAIIDLEDVDLNDNAYYKCEPKSMYAKLLRGKISINDYLGYLKKKSKDIHSTCIQLSLFK